MLGLVPALVGIVVAAPRLSVTVPAGDLTEWLAEHPLQPNTTLVLAPGEHALSTTLRLGANATGLRMTGEAGVRVTGGYTVPAGAWKIVRRGSIEVWSAQLPPGTWAAGDDPPRQLWTNNGRRTRARHPNLWNRDVSALNESPYMYWMRPLVTDYGGLHCSVHSCKLPCRDKAVCEAAARTNRYGFRYNYTTDGELMDLLSSHNCSSAPLPGEGYCAGLQAIVYHGWTVSRSFVSGIFTAGHSIHLRNPADRPIGFWTGLDSEGGQRYYLENAEALLDAPGEFFIKSSGIQDGGGTLMYIPVEGEAPATLNAVLPRMQELVVVDRASNLQFSALEFSHSDWSCGGPGKNQTCDDQSAQEQHQAAIRVRNARDVYFDRVNITHVGLQALWFEQGVTDASFSGGRIVDLGTGAIRVGPWSTFPGMDPLSKDNDRNDPGDKPEAVHNISVSDSFLSDGGWVFAAGTALLVQANTTNVSITHCELSYFSYTAISVGWSWNFSPQTTHSHLISDNYIHHLGYPRRETGDAMACIYTLGQLNNTVVSGNVCHDVRAYRSGGYCLSQDQGSSNIRFESNVCLRTTASPHNTHYGENLTYVNNVFWGGGWSSKVSDSQLVAGCLRTSPQRGLPDRLRFDTNLIGQVNNPIAQLFEGNFNASSQPYEYNFTFRSNLYWSDLQGPSGNLATAPVFGGESSRVLGKRNGVWIAPRKFTWQQWQSQGQDVGSAVLPQGQHPFASDDWSTTLDVRLKPGIGEMIGFRPIDTSTVGIRSSPGKSTIVPGQTCRQKLIDLCSRAKRASKGDCFICVGKSHSESLG